MVQRKVSKGNLPVELTSFVGRRREITGVRKALAAARLVTLAGVGGVGKTRLALETAAEAGKSYPDGVWLVQLASVRDPALVARTAARALGIPDQSRKPALAQLVDHLADREALIVLDNCEHLLDACAELADRLLRGAARLRILATSRHVLGIAGEHVFPVPPLSVPDADHPPSVPALRVYDSVGLLIDRARAVRPDFEVREADVPAVSRLCARLDGLPLAIELAASRLRSMPVGQLADRIEDRFGLLTSGSRTALPRQRTLRALIDWSHDLCSPRERLLWTRLSVFAGGFDLAAAEGVCSDGELPAHAVLDLLDHLVAQSIVVPDEQPGRTRYRMLETIREYGWHKLADSGGTEHARHRHQAFFLDLSRRMAEAWAGPGQEQSLAVLRADHDNLRAALEWSLADPSRAREAMTFVTCLRYHWCADGFLSEGRRWLDRALSGPADPTPERANALWVAAWVMLLQGDYFAAESRLAECENLAAQTGERLAAQEATTLRGTLALFRGEPAQAVEFFENAIAALTAAGADEGVGLVMFQLAIALAHVRNDRASEVAERAIAWSGQRGERWAKSYALWVFGFTAFLQERFDVAGERIRAALEIQSDFNDHVGSALMLEQAAWIAAGSGDHRRAAVLLGAVDGIWRAVGTTLRAFGPHLSACHERCERSVSEALRADLRTAALAEGARLDLPRAIGYALHGAADATLGEPKPDNVLSHREKEIAELVAQGLTNRGISETLVISARTVESHVDHILTKLGFTSRSQIAAWVGEHRAADVPR